MRADLRKLLADDIAELVKKSSATSIHRRIEEFYTEIARHKPISMQALLVVYSICMALLLFILQAYMYPLWLKLAFGFGLSTIIILRSGFFYHPWLYWYRLTHLKCVFHHTWRRIYFAIFSYVDDEQQFRAKAWRRFLPLVVIGAVSFLSSTLYFLMTEGFTLNTLFSFVLGGLLVFVVISQHKCQAVCLVR
ncbi:MAG: hypothetical protein V1725_06210 [archaeon]